MSAEIARGLERIGQQERTRVRTPRMRAVLALGPVTAVAGVLWAIAQPWRITLLHPHGQGFWWLVAEPPVYVVAAGLFFWRVVARGLVADLEEAGR
jgi:hypothetical protein